MQCDLLIKGGRIYDGHGGQPYDGDIAILDGKILKIGTFEGEATRVLNAEGLIVTPGFVDLHTHYDGQISWDDKLEPSVYHGVTSVTTTSGLPTTFGLPTIDAIV